MIDFVCNRLVGHGTDKTFNPLGLSQVNADLAHVESFKGDTVTLKVAVGSVPVEILGKATRTNRYKLVTVDCVSRTIPSELGSLGQDGNPYPRDGSPRYARVVSVTESLEEIRELATRQN